MAERRSVSMHEPVTMVDLLRRQAVRQPDKVAYIYLADGEQEGCRLTYAELDRQARAIGATLQQHVAPGERAVLMFPAGMEFVTAFYGCLYAGVIAVPAFPPNLARLDRTLPRLRTIANDARPALALTQASILSKSEALFAQAPDFRSISWLASDDVSDDTAAEWRDPELDGDTLAFLQYTSGSTAAPKGVMVSHGNLVCNEHMLEQGWDHCSETIIVSWLPLFHDMGLIGNVLHSMYLGGTCILMAPAAFLQRPVRWLQAITRYRAWTAGAPNFAYDLCVQKTSDEQRAQLDLSSWRVAYNGSEPVRAATLQRFAATFAPYGLRPEALYPCYGLAEATLFVSGGKRWAPPILHTVQADALQRNQVVPAEAGETAQTTVGCGETWDDQQIRIVDPLTLRACPDDQVGEIWVSGPHVAHGYWNNDEATARTFRARLADTGEGPYLRTGDLGFLRDGELFITGRLKDVIIINGRNHYPQDIEQTVEASHPAIRQGCCAAFAVEVDGEERLIVAAEIDRHYRPQGRVVRGELTAAADGDVITRTIRRAVVENHELRAYEVVLLKVGGMAKTSSGKVQRQACRARHLGGTLELWDSMGEPVRQIALESVC